VVKLNWSVGAHVQVMVGILSSYFSVSHSKCGQWETVSNKSGSVTKSNFGITNQIHGIVLLTESVLFVEEITAFYGNRNFITVFRISCHRAL
jgi:hypothetical protein